METIQIVLIVLFTLAAFFWDAIQMKIPNAVNLTGAMTGFLFHLFTSGANGLLYACLSFLTLLAVTWLLYVIQAIGAGDAKWYASLGAIAGFHFSILALIYSILIAGTIGLVVLLGYSKNRRKLKFPFMYAALPGVVMAYFGG